MLHVFVAAESEAGFMASVTSLFPFLQVSEVWGRKVEKHRNWTPGQDGAVRGGNTTELWGHSAVAARTRAVQDIRPGWVYTATVTPAVLWLDRCRNWESDLTGPFLSQVRVFPGTRSTWLSRCRTAPSTWHTTQLLTCCMVAHLMVARVAQWVSSKHLGILFLQIFVFYYLGDQAHIFRCLPFTIWVLHLVACARAIHAHASSSGSGDALYQDLNQGGDTLWCHSRTVAKRWCHSPTSLVCLHF